jgi:magnesium transporter
MQQNTDKEIDIMVDHIRQMLQSGDTVALKDFLAGLHYADIAEVIDELEEHEQNEVFKHLSEDQASRVLEEIDSDDFESIFTQLNPEQQSDMLELMSSDDIADQLYDLTVAEQDSILAMMDQEDQDEVKALLDYHEETAGGIMTKDYIDVGVDMTIAEALSYLRLHAPDAETIYYVYVTNHIGVLSGIITLRQLIIAQEHQKISDIMKENVITINVSADQEEAVRIVKKYDLLALPVVDDDHRLLGIITVDDIMDVMEEEATEDILRFAGTTEDELDSIDEENTFVGAWISMKARLPWLIITILGGLITAKVISNFQQALETDATIALFMPLLAGMGGNVGTQSSTLTVRNIAIGAIGKGMLFRVLFQEIIVGFLVGIICSVLVAGATFILEGRVILSLIVGLAMWANMVTAATIGTLVPLAFRRLGIDPAVASAPFISTTIDITGLTIYFTLVVLMLQHIIA